MSELAPLRILTAESVDKLRLVAASADPSPLWVLDLEQLISDFDLRDIESEYEVNLSQTLQLSLEGVASRELDVVNSERILHALPNITPADATDERLWVTLALGPYRGYLLDRWPKDAGALGSHVLNHVFASSSRGRYRDHAIARLWWSGYFVSRVMPESVGDALRTLYYNSDLANVFLGTTHLAKVRPVSIAMLKLFKAHIVDASADYNRGGVRAFVQGVDFVAGRRALGTLPADEVYRVLEPSLVANLTTGDGRDYP